MTDQPPTQEEPAEAPGAATHDTPERAPSELARIVARAAPHALLVLVVVLAAAAFRIIAYFKIGSMLSWQYTTDLYIYDLVMQETLRGNFGLDYTFGNQFGEHALLLLLLMLPLKLLVGKQMVFLLVLMGPFVYASVGVFLFLVVRHLASGPFALLSATLYLVGFATLRGLHEPVYGCHFDIFAGYVVTAFVSLLIVRQRVLYYGNKPSRSLMIGIWATYAFFVCIKEEMTLLAAVFFLLVVVFRRERFYLVGLAVSGAVFLAQMLFILACNTEWNRTNAFLVRKLAERLRDQGLAEVLFSGSMPQVWIAASVLSAVFVALCLAGGSRRRLTAALFLTGLVKMGLALVVGRVSTLTTWHNFSALTMLTGAVILQAASLHSAGGAIRRRVAWAFGTALLVAAVAGVFLTEIPYAKSIPYAMRGEKRQIRLPWGVDAGRQRSLREVKKSVVRGKVVAINGSTAIDWANGYRYCPFPHGVERSPRGVADYVLLDLLFPTQRIQEFVEERVLGEFEPIVENQGFVLFRRKAITAEHAAERKRFVDLYGEDAVGVRRRASSPKDDGKDEPRDADE